jgi:hypothetical protein
VKNKKDKDAPVEVFAGTSWETALVKSLLDNAEIGAFMVDESMGTLAPWNVGPGGHSAVKLFVARHDYELAMIVVDDFYRNRNSSQD